MEMSECVDAPVMTNKDLLIPYAAPYFAYVALGTLLGDHIKAEWDYTARLLIVAALLVFFRNRYVPITGPRNPYVSVFVGALAGILGAALWIALLQPLLSPGGEKWSDASFALRFVAAGFVVPVFEELLMRGYVLRLALQWDMARKAGISRPFEKAYFDQSIFQVGPGMWNMVAIIISSVVFALGHQMREWPAAVVYGLLMGMLWVVRKDLLTCMVAHGITNIALAFYVRATGYWELW